MATGQPHVGALEASHAGDVAEDPAACCVTTDRHSLPLVSVIVPFLNPPEPFFREAIESVFAQTYDRWELLLVDDGSTDISTTVAHEYVQRFPDQVRYLEHPGHQNRGMSASRNLGIQEAKGVYVAFLDADDVWLLHKLEKQVAILESHPDVAMVYGGQIRWFNWNGTSEGRRRDFCKEVKVPEYDTPISPPYLIQLYLRKRAISGVCSILVRRDIAVQVGGFEESVSFSEDQTINFKVAFKHAVIVTKGPDWKYRRHPDSYMARLYGTKQKTQMQLVFLDWVKTALFEAGIDDPAMWRALNRRYRARRWMLAKQSVPTSMIRRLRSSPHHRRAVQWAKRAAGRSRDAIRRRAGAGYITVRQLVTLIAGFFS